MDKDKKDLLKLLHQVGEYKIDLEACKNSKGFDLVKIRAQQRKVGLEIVKTEANINEKTADYVSFLCNTSGLKNKEIAAYLGIRPGQLSAYKKGAKGLSSLGWSSIRHFFHGFLSKGRVESAVYLNNKEMAVY